MAADPVTAATVEGLFNYDSTDDERDPFNDKPAPARQTAAAAGDGFGADLGLDEEVKVAKKRKPIAKLDEER
jgi:replication fork protection complex subunit Csm3/Swi3